MKKGTLILAASIVAVLVGFFVFSRFFVDLLWFSSLGFRAVFTTTWLTALGVFVVATGLSSAILLLNGFIAARATPAGRRRQPSFRVIGRGTQGMPEIIELSLDKLPWRLIIAGVALLVGLFIGFAQMDNWDTLLKWFYAVPFGRTDPLFGKDLGFYVFSLPVYELIRDWALLIIFLSAAAAVCDLPTARRHRLSADRISCRSARRRSVTFPAAGAIFSRQSRRLYSAAL